MTRETAIRLRCLIRSLGERLHPTARRQPYAKRSQKLPHLIVKRTLHPDKLVAGAEQSFDLVAFGGFDVHGRKPARVQHLRQRKGIGFVALDPMLLIASAVRRASIHTIELMGERTGGDAG